jgi:hypothetical protein
MPNVEEQKMYRTLALVKGKTTELIREYQPVKRTIVYREDEYCEYKEKTYLLQFPTMLFMWNRGRLHVAFTKRPIKSLDDLVYCPPMGNIYDDWAVCGCNSGSLTGSIKIFWRSEFTDDGEAGIDALNNAFNGRYGSWKRIRSPEGIIKKINGSPFKDGESTFRDFMGFADLYVEDDDFACSNVTLNLKAKYLSKFEGIIPKKRQRIKK